MEPQPSVHPQDPSPIFDQPDTGNLTRATPRAIVVFDIDGVVRDVAGSYRRALADTVEEFTAGVYRPTLHEIDLLKAEGVWNNDWEASQELIYRFFEGQGQDRTSIGLDYAAIVDFFQSRYRGVDFSGYIQDEPLLMSAAYLKQLSAADIAWGFFSGATRGSATYVLEKRLGLVAPILVAMEDAPSKPDPQGLQMTVAQLSLGAGDRVINSTQVMTTDSQNPPSSQVPVFYVGDTVADLHTVQRARALNPERLWIGVGVLPPHAQEQAEYTTRLTEAGAQVVLNNVEQLTPEKVTALLA